MMEMNLDGLVAPSHHYAGLSYGNFASAANAGQVANPKAAALQGLEKMRLMAELGLLQGIFPPPDVPRFSVLRDLGFSGTSEQMLQDCYRVAPKVLSAIYSASAMWMANAATVSASADTADGRIHITPANLQSIFHRSLETAHTERVLRKIFADDNVFCIHPSLPKHSDWADEGAANHTRFWLDPDNPGISLFVYGQSCFDSGFRARSTLYPARQTLEASVAIARSHGLRSELTIFAQQNPDAIDHGAFHNDVVAVGHANLLLCHQQAFTEPRQVREQLVSYFQDRGQEFHWLEVPAKQISLDLAVQSYLFNSQIVTLPSKEMLIIAPEECREHTIVWDFLQELCIGDNPIARVLTVDLRQSMSNGGGPACLRLRVPLDESAVKASHQGIIFNDELHTKLQSWVRRYYRDRLVIDDLVDPQFFREVQAALDALTSILDLGSIYDFQKI